MEFVRLKREIMYKLGQTILKRHNEATGARVEMEQKNLKTGSVYV
jgi:hypothetical protein